MGGGGAGVCRQLWSEWWSEWVPGEGEPYWGGPASGAEDEDHGLFESPSLGPACPGDVAFEGEAGGLAAFQNLQILGCANGGGVSWFPNKLAAWEA